MPNETSVELPDELLTAISASGRSIPDLIRAGLEAERRAQEEIWLAGLVADLIGKLNDGYVLAPRKP
jgi:hypothetical protein